jgi:hypothetical protein
MITAPGAARRKYREDGTLASHSKEKRMGTSCRLPRVSANVSVRLKGASLVRRGVDG